MPLSYPAAPPSQRELRKVGGGGGGGVARRARAARALKPRSCATSRYTSSATCSAASCATFFTCLSFTCRPRAAWGAACVRWAWVPPMEGDDNQYKHLHAPVLCPRPAPPPSRAEFKNSKYKKRQLVAALSRANSTKTKIENRNHSPRAPPPDPQLKSGPVFVASGGLIITKSAASRERQKRPIIYAFARFSWYN